MGLSGESEDRELYGTDEKTSRRKWTFTAAGSFLTPALP